MGKKHQKVCVTLNYIEHFLILAYTQPLDEYEYEPVHKKWSFPFRISSVNETKSAGNW